jgi:biopolymer transport protein ExbB/TolQ
VAVLVSLLIFAWLCLVTWQLLRIAHATEATAELVNALVDHDRRQDLAREFAETNDKHVPIRTLSSNADNDADEIAARCLAPAPGDHPFHKGG